MTHEAAGPESTRRAFFSRRFLPGVGRSAEAREATTAVLLDAMPREEPGDYDIYLLAQTWSPMFCCKKADR